MKHNRTHGSVGVAHPMRQPLILMAMIALALLAFASTAYAHAVTAGDKGYIQEVSGMKLIPFMYLGAKHMVTGYDHLLSTRRWTIWEPISGGSGSSPTPRPQR